MNEKVNAMTLVNHFQRLSIRRDFPGIRIGPEPTTDRFIAVMYDDKEGVVPGNALVVDPNKQFRPLSKYGNAVSSIVLDVSNGIHLIALTFIVPESLPMLNCCVARFKSDIDRRHSRDIVGREAAC